jgi:hypothetical protein
MKKAFWRGCFHMLVWGGILVSSGTCDSDTHEVFKESECAGWRFQHLPCSPPYSNSQRVPCWQSTHFRMRVLVTALGCHVGKACSLERGCW